MSMTLLVSCYKDLLDDCETIAFLFLLQSATAGAEGKLNNEKAPNIVFFKIRPRTF